MVDKERAAELRRRYWGKKDAERHAAAPELPPHLAAQLQSIDPQPIEIMMGRVFVFPCGATLKDGTVEDCMYLMSAPVADLCWWIREKPELGLDQIAAVFPSRHRLHVKWATQILEGGESGMGFVCGSFTMADGATLYWSSTEGLEFPDLPGQYTPNDVVAVTVHDRRTGKGHFADGEPLGTKPFKWAVFRKVKDSGAI